MSTSTPSLPSPKSLSLNVPYTPPAIFHRNTSTLSVRLDTWKGVNAFERKPFSCYEKLKILFMTITGIILLRAVLFVVIGLLLYLFSIPVTCCNDPRKPLSYWRKPFQWCMYLLVRVELFVLGFVWIQTDAKHKFTNPRIVVANHHTIYDGFILWWLCHGTAASRIENKLPIAGRIADGFQTIWIDRMAKSGRRKAIQQILSHVADPSLPPLVIFPQGVCSEIGCITTFKKGAFLAGIAVHPVGIDWYWNMHADLSFLNENTVLELLYGMSQIINFCTVQFLDPHEPTEKERHDPMLYANDVRQEIVEKLGVISTAHTLSDYILLKHSKATDAKFDTSKFVMEDVTDRLLFRTRTVTKLCDRYCELDIDDDGFIDYPEFCEAFKRDPHSNGMKHLFRLFNTKNLSMCNEETLREFMDYDKLKNKKIGFEDFLVGVSVCYVDSMIEDGVTIMFDINKSDESHIMKSYVIEAYTRSKDVNYNDNESDDNAQYDDYDQEMQHFCNVMFENDNEKLDFETFYERVLSNKQQQAVHHFLQMMITFRLGIELTESDFIDEDRITVKVGNNLLRSQSIKR